MKLINVLIITVFMLLLGQSAHAQFANSKKKGKDIMFAFGAGGSGADAGSYSLIGGNLMLEFRKPIALIAQNYSVSINLTLSSVLGSASQTGKESEFDFLPSGMLTVSFNAFSQSTKIAKNTLGGFLGVGLMVMPSKSVESKDREGNTITKKTGLFGPAVLLGPRFRIGKTYLDLRLYGGMTLGGDTEMAFGGLNVMFTFGMGKAKRHGMQ